MSDTDIDNNAFEKKYTQLINEQTLVEDTIMLVDNALSGSSSGSPELGRQLSDRKLMLEAKLHSITSDIDSFNDGATIPLPSDKNIADIKGLMLETEQLEGENLTGAAVLTLGTRVSQYFIDKPN